MYPTVLAARQQEHRIGQRYRELVTDLVGSKHYLTLKDFELTASWWSRLIDNERVQIFEYLSIDNAHLNARKPIEALTPEAIAGLIGFHKRLITTYLARHQKE